jgi:hypothetical protein
MTMTKKNATTSHDTHETTSTTKEPIMKKTSKDAATSTSTSNETASVGGIAPLPASGAPSIATSAVPKQGTMAKRPRAPKLFTSLAAGIVKDIGSSTTYAADFGKNAPSQQDLAARVALAAGWADEDAKSKAWALYAHDQATRGWQVTQPRIYELAPAFKYAMERDPTIAERYASVVSFFGLATAAAQRAVATRRAKKKGAATPTEEKQAAKATVKAQVIEEEAARDAAESTVAATPPPTGTGGATAAAH